MKLRQKFSVLAPAVMVLTLAASSLYAQDSTTRSNQQAQPAQQSQQAQQGQQAQQAQQNQQNQQRAQTAEQAGEKRAATGAAGGTQSLTDGQILQIVRTLNDAEIKQAEEARDEGESEAVKQVAEMIITDHEASNEQMDELLEGSLNMEDGDMNERIADQAEQTHERLQGLAGAEYDCAYLQAQVQQHDMALEMAKAQLTPAAKEAGVKQYLTAMAPKLEHHRQMAQDAMGQLQGCSAGQNQQSQSESSQERDQQQRTQQSQSQPAPRTQQ